MSIKTKNYLWIWELEFTWNWERTCSEISVRVLACVLYGSFHLI